MNVIVSIMRTLAVALVLVLTATGLWAAGAEEEAPAAAAANKKYVTDPTTGEPVVAPEYGGTITVPWNEEGPNPDVMLSGWYGMFTTGVLERLANGDWGIDRSEFSFKTSPPCICPDRGAGGKLVAARHQNRYRQNPPGRALAR